MKYQTQNGWTKESMIAHINAEFKGKSATGRNMSETCLYRGPEGRKCAVGMFIPDDLYHADMEGKTAEGINEKYADINVFFPLTLRQMDFLQDVHDSSHPDNTLKEMLQWIEKNVE